MVESMVEYRFNVINPEIGIVETHIFTKEELIKALKEKAFIRGNMWHTFAALHSLMCEVIERMTDDNVALIGDYIKMTYYEDFSTTDDVRDWLKSYGMDYLDIDMRVNGNLYFCSWCSNPLFSIISNIT